MSSPPRVPVIMIVGSGRCGSTLLNQMLDTHSRIVALNEIAGLERMLRRDFEHEESPRSSPFWRSVEACWETMSGRSLDTIRSRSPRLRTIPLYHRWSRARGGFLEDTDRLFRCTLSAGDATHVVDASKSASRAWVMSGSSRFRLFLVHLVRDGRAVVNSYVRSGKSFWRALRIWTYAVVSGLALEQLYENGRQIRIRYEDLAADPESCMRSILELASLAYEGNELRFRDRRHHGIGGNAMQYRPADPIRPDARWRDELDRRHRHRFHLAGGWLNARLGYGEDP